MKNNLFNVLLKSDNVNTYTKVLILLNVLSFNNDYYIPTTKLINLLKKYDIILENRQVRRTLNRLYTDNLIGLYYKGNKRYFNLKFFNYQSKKKDSEAVDHKVGEVPNWLEDE